MSYSKLKEIVSNFFLKLKYLLPVFFLFLIIIDYFQKPQFDFSIYFWINSIAFLLSLVWIIVSRRVTRITFRKGGLQINSKAYRVLFPWLYMQFPFISSPEKGHILINMSSVHPGQSFHVKKYQFSTDGKEDSEWLKLLKEGVQLQITNAFDIGAIRKKIESFTKKNSITFNKSPAEGTVKGINIGESDRLKGIACIERGQAVTYPAFCPITGGDIYKPISIGGVEIPVSSKGAFLWKQAKNLRAFLSMAFALIFISMGYLAALHGTWVLLLSLVTFGPLYIAGWLYLRKRIQVLKVAEESITLQFSDKEYSGALIYMNYPFSESLPSE